MDLKHWRDIAAHYDNDPSTKMLSVDEKMRLVALSLGVKDALTLPIDIIGKEMREAQKNPNPNWWQLSEGKKREITHSANELNQGSLSSRSKTMGVH